MTRTTEEGDSDMTSGVFETVADTEARIAKLVARGESQLILARAEAAKLQAEARRRLDDVIAREQALERRPTLAPAGSDAVEELLEEARQQAEQIVAEARVTSRQVLLEARTLLAVARRHALADIVDPGGNEASDPPPDRPPRTPAVVIDDRGDLPKASRYRRRSAQLPSLGEEAGKTIAAMGRIREKYTTRDSENPD